MKHMVMVNGKYMVAVEADSNCAAEHAILDKFADEINSYQVIESALAFDKKEMKGNYFFECLETCETISMGELEAKVADVVAKKFAEVKAYEAYEEKEREMEELKAEWTAIQVKYSAMVSEKSRERREAHRAAISAEIEAKEAKI